MVEVIVFAEGVTEEKFIKQIIAPSLHHLGVFVKPQMLNTSQDAKGGAVSFDRLKFNARNTLRQNQNFVLTTFLDLYGLDTNFPKYSNSKKIADVYGRVACLEQALHEEIVNHIQCRPERFIPHIQPYEFEGLLFSNVSALSNVEPNWTSKLNQLIEARNSAETPEHINDGYETKPSKRLETILDPKYKKTRHGPLAAQRITLATIEQECSHFKQWVDNLRKLAT